MTAAKDCVRCPVWTDKAASLNRNQYVVPNVTFPIRSTRGTFVIEQTSGEGLFDLTSHDSYSLGRFVLESRSCQWCKGARIPGQARSDRSTKPDACTSRGGPKRKAAPKN
jgi:hypothetical protein